MAREMGFFSDARDHFRYVRHRYRYIRKCATTSQPRIIHVILGLSMGGRAPYFFQLFIDTSLWKMTDETIAYGAWREMGLQRFEINCL